MTAFGRTKEIAAWNQKKLEKDFCLGPTTHRSRDYKQTLYRFGDYSEVRGFWMNQYPDKGLFNCSIIIPESEVVDEGNYTIFLPPWAVSGPLTSWSAPRP